MKENQKSNKPKSGNPFALYLCAFNTQSSAVLQATRVWAVQRLVPQPRPDRTTR